MQIRSTHTLLWPLLFVVGCGGGDGGCMGAIPGGFPAEERVPNALSAKVSSQGLGQLESLVSGILLDSFSLSGFDVPCTKMTQRIDIAFGQGVSVDFFICDIDNNKSCNASDATNRPDVPGSGVTCRADISIEGIRLQPRQNADSTVDVKAEVDLRVNTGRIPVTSEIPIPFSSPCKLKCELEYDSDIRAPAWLPVTATMRLTVDSNYENLLAFEMPNIEDITQAIDTQELEIDGSGCVGFACDTANIGFVKDLLFDQIQGLLTRQLRDAVDGFRCRACETGTNNCPAGSSCQNGLCYVRYEPSNKPEDDLRICAPSVLGMEGRVNVGELLAGFGPAESELDISIVAGGRSANGKPSVSAQTGGLVLGFMGGSRPVEASHCVPAAEWEARPMPPEMNFDAELSLPTPGLPSVGGYHLGIGLSDRYLDKTLFDAWKAGVLCLEIGTSTVSMISSGLFATFLPSLNVVSGGRDVPLLLALRPSSAPSIRLGRGTVRETENGSQPDDALITLEAKDFSIDFYALLEERQVRLFSLTVDLKLPLSLEFDAAAGTVTPVLGGLDTLLTNVRASKSEILAEDPESLSSLIGSIMGLVQPALAGALGPIALPELQGFKLEVLGARGSIQSTSFDGYEHLALYAKLSQATVAPFSTRHSVSASLSSLELPTLEALRAGALPRVSIDAIASGLTPLAFQGYEYSWRVNGGFWNPWTTHSRIDVNSPVLALEGRHLVEVRVREKGVVESTSLEPAKVYVEVDYQAPLVRLELDRESREVRTHASDQVTPAEELSFRYRIGKGDFVSFPGAKSFPLDELGEEPVLEVEVRDNSGHVSTARFGSFSSEQPLRGLQTEASGGCAAAGAASLALAGLALLLRRRRS